MCNVDKIRSLAKSKGIKLSYISNQLGLSTSFFVDVSKGKNSINESRLVKIAKILETTPEYLRDETDNPEIPVGNDDILKGVNFAFSKLTGDPTEITEEDLEIVKSVVIQIKKNRSNNKDGNNK